MNDADICGRLFEVVGVLRDAVRSAVLFPWKGSQLAVNMHNGYGFHEFNCVFLVKAKRVLEPQKKKLLE